MPVTYICTENSAGGQLFKNLNDGSGWTVETLPVSGVGWRHIWGYDTNCVYLSGGGANLVGDTKVLKFDGVTWSDITSTIPFVYTSGAGAEQPIRIHGTGPDNVTICTNRWGSGSGGGWYRWNGSSWYAIISDAGNYSACYINPDGATGLLGDGATLYGGRTKYWTAPLTFVDTNRVPPDTPTVLDVEGPMVKLNGIFYLVSYLNQFWALRGDGATPPGWVTFHTSFSPDISYDIHGYYHADTGIELWCCGTINIVKQSTDGLAWTARNNASPADDNRGVFVREPGNVLVVGRSINHPPRKAHAHRWNGSAWSEETLPANVGSWEHAWSCWEVQTPDEMAGTVIPDLRDVQRGAENADLGNRATGPGWFLNTDGDNVITDYDLLRDPTGIITRATIRLRVRRGSWIGDKDIGSRLHEIDNTAAARRELADVIREALQPLIDDGSIADVVVGEIEVSELDGRAAAEVGLVTSSQDVLPLGLIPFGTS
jgi:phage gp46-like protein